MHFDRRANKIWEKTERYLYTSLRYFYNNFLLQKNTMFIYCKNTTTKNNKVFTNHFVEIDEKCIYCRTTIIKVTKNVWFPILFVSLYSHRFKINTIFLLHIFNWKINISLEMKLVFAKGPLTFLQKKGKKIVNSYRNDVTLLFQRNLSLGRRSSIVNGQHIYIYNRKMCLCVYICSLV